MRRLISLFLASLMTATGGGLTLLSVFVHHLPMRLGAAGMLMLGIGIVWLYSDFTERELS
jgi:hypothetical protein